MALVGEVFQNKKSFDKDYYQRIGESKFTSYC